MRLVTGTAEALAWCERRLAAGRAAARRDAVAAAVAEVVASVRDRGEAAVLELTARFDGVRPSSVRVPAAALEAGAARVPPELRDAIDLAIDRVEAFYRRQAAEGFELVDGDSRLGAVAVPLESVGCYVPGGSARCSRACT